MWNEIAPATRHLEPNLVGYSELPRGFREAEGSPRPISGTAR